MQIISRQEALALGLKRYFTGKPCKRSHVAERMCTGGTCVLCQNENTARWNATNKARLNGRQRQWRLSKGRQYHRECERRYAVNHPSELREKKRRYYYADPDKSAAIASWHRMYGQHPDAIVPGVTYKDVLPFYTKARRLSRETGTEHHVDHIIPLARGGKHEPSNLQVISAVSNLKKGSKLPEEIAVG